MISKKTLFILGAGAHIPYGFSSGKALMGYVVDQLARGIRDAELSLRTLPQRSGVNIDIVQQENIEKFVESLNQAGQARSWNFLLIR